MGKIFISSGQIDEFQGKLWLMIILKVTKNQGFTLSLEDSFMENQSGGGGGAKTTPPHTPVFKGLTL